MNSNDHFLTSSSYTPSNPFTPSKFFTPKRTKIPDPQSIFDNGRKNISIFSKEEVKKAAVPLTLLAVILALSIAGFFFYLFYHIKILKNSEKIPYFDSSFNDNDDETDSNFYSYSYYTYSESDYV